MNTLYNITNIQWTRTKSSNNEYDKQFCETSRPKCKTAIFNKFGKCSPTMLRDRNHSILTKCAYFEFFLQKLHLGSVTQVRYRNKAHIKRPAPIPNIKYEAMAASLKMKG